MALAGQPELSPVQRIQPLLEPLQLPSSLQLLDTMLRLIPTQLARPAFTRLLRPTRLALLPPTSSSIRRSLSSSPLRRNSDERLPGAPMSLFNFTEEEVMLRDSGPSLLPCLALPCLACVLQGSVKLTSIICLRPGVWGVNSQAVRRGRRWTARQADGRRGSDGSFGHFRLV